MVVDSILSLLSGVAVGVILFQTAVIAPTVFKGLGAEHAGPFLRKVFPKFFMILMVLGIVKGMFAATAGQIPRDLGCRWHIFISGPILQIDSADK